MAMLFQATSFSEVWKELLTNLLNKGQESCPRGQKTREILNVTIEVVEGRKNILYNVERDLNYRFMIAEWLWIQAGLSDVETLATYNSVMRNFSDDNIILSGAYGPRLAPQWHYVITALNQPDSRQAVSVIWTPHPSYSKDIPCTLTLQWLIRNSQLHCTINMRSSDVWLGLPYDYFTFSQLTNHLASLIEIEVGSITMNLASSHIYEQHFEIGTAAFLSIENTTIESPAIPYDVYLPSAGEMADILKQKIPQGHFEDSIWGRYAEALTKNKHNALEVLLELDPSRKTK
jgi:thymidylate synthase